jgi:hypothetical protein
VKPDAPLLVLVGGFLGAGKTSLILRAAGTLRQRGLRAAAIMNDQDQALVDTEYSTARDVETGEVAGGCFCCLFSDLLEAAEALRAHSPDVIFAEPVGSCVDLSATVVRPLASLYAVRWRVAPLTVLVDPEFAARVDDGRAGDDAAFLFRNQVAEADLLCVSKCDRYAEAPRLPFPVDFHLSAATGQGVSEWLAEVMDSSRVAGARTLDIDYARYAEAEASLAWLNLHAQAALDAPASPATIAGTLLDELDRRLSEAGAAIAHLKVFDRAPTGYVKASICANGDEPDPEGDLAASPSRRHEFTVNLRASGEPRVFEQIVRQAAEGIAGEVKVRHLRAFRPAPPKPEHRMANATDPRP